MNPMGRKIGLSLSRQFFILFLYISQVEKKKEETDLPCLEKRWGGSRDHLLIPEEEAVTFCLFFEIGGISAKGAIDWDLSQDSQRSGQLLSRGSITEQKGCFSFWSWGKALVGAIPPTESLVKWSGWTSYLSENACSPIKRAFFPSSFRYHHFHPFPSFSNQALH